MIMLHKTPNVSKAFICLKMQLYDRPQFTMNLTDIVTTEYCLTFCPI